MTEEPAGSPAPAPPGRPGAPAAPATPGVPAVPGVLDADEVRATGRAIADLQLPDGMIPWFEGGHCDPWNHVECAMALTACGLTAEARRAFEWLAQGQLADGSWFNYYLADGVKDPRLDTNVCAYVAAGVYHHHLVTGEVDGLERWWPMVERALDFVLRWQRPDGSVEWSLDPAGRPEGDALLTGSSSIYHSLRCGAALAERLGHDRPDWELASGRVGHAVAHHPGAFAPKDEFAMDWYYPVLAGALGRDAGCLRIEAGWGCFVMERLGVRCVSTSDWVTAAETAELALALDAVGMDQLALEVLAAGQGMRLPDGSYWTGMAYPDEVPFPAGERTSYTAAAMVLAADALSDTTGGAGLFRRGLLPDGLDLAEPWCDGLAAGCTARA